jgi:hypothetical protein
MQNYCSSFTSPDEITTALAWAKSQGLFSLSTDRYTSCNDGFMTSQLPPNAACNSNIGEFLLQSWTALNPALFSSASALLLSGKPILAVITRRSSVIASAARGLLLYRGTVEYYAA